MIRNHICEQTSTKYKFHYCFTTAYFQTKDFQGKVLNLSQFDLSGGTIHISTQADLRFESN